MEGERERVGIKKRNEEERSKLKWEVKKKREQIERRHKESNKEV